MNNLNFNESWLNTEEAAQYLGVTTRTIANYRMRGQVPFSQIGRVIRYRKTDIDAFLMAHYVEPKNYGGGSHGV